MDVLAITTEYDLLRAQQRPISDLMTSKSTDLETIGEQHVIAALAALGYSCRQGAEFLGSADIVATGPASLLVQIRTSLYPAPPADLTSEERCEIAARAAAIGCQAWLAKLRVNSLREPVGEIIWGQIAN